MSRGTRSHNPPLLQFDSNDEVVINENVSNPTMSRSTRSHKPELVRFGSHDEVVSLASEHKPRQASTTRKRSAPETPTQHSSKRAKTAPSSNAATPKTVPPSKATPSKNAPPAKATPSSKSVPSKSAPSSSMKRGESIAKHSPMATRQSAREKSVELPRQVPAPQLPSTRTTRRSEPAEEEGGETEPATARSKISARVSDVPKSSKREDVWDMPKSSPIKAPRRSIRQSDQHIVQKQTTEAPKEEKVSRNTENAANKLFGMNDKTKATAKNTSTKPAVSGKDNTKKKQPVERRGDNGPRESAKPTHTVPSEPSTPKKLTKPLKPSAPSPAGSKASAQAGRPGQTPKKETRGRKPKPKPEGLEEEPKRPRGRPRKSDIAPAVQATAAVRKEEVAVSAQEEQQAAAVPQQEAQADADDEGTDEAIAAKLNDALVEEELYTGAVDDSGEEEKAREDIVTKTHFHSGPKEAKSSFMNEEMSGSESEGEEYGYRPSHKLGAQKPPKKGPMQSQNKNRNSTKLVVQQSQDPAGEAQKAFYKTLSKYSKRQRRLYSMFENFYKNTKDERRELAESRKAVESAFSELVDSLDTKGTYAYARSLDRNYNLKNVDPRRAPHLPGDPFGAYAETFDARDEKLRDLFKDSAERSADMELLEQVKDRIQDSLEESHEHLQRIDRFIADAERPITVFENEIDEVENLLRHEENFPLDYQNIRLEQAEKIRETNMRRLKFDPMRIMSSLSSRERQKRRLEPSNGVPDHRREEMAVVQRESSEDLDFRWEEEYTGETRRKNTSEWTQAEDQTLCVGIDKFGLAPDNFIMIKQTYGSVPGSVLYNREGSDIQARARELKAIILDQGGQLPSTWANIS